MIAEEFVSILRDVMPSKAELLEYGLEADEISEIQSTFLAIHRTGSENVEQPEVLRLISEFDCSRVEIGLVRFLDRPITCESGIQFASCEADPLLVKTDATIVMIEKSASGICEMKCAIDSLRFLDGLASFLKVRANKAKWKTKVGEAVSQCSNSAGGRDSDDFFRILCSFLA